MILHNSKEDIMSTSNRAIAVANTSLLVLVVILLFIIPVFTGAINGYLLTGIGFSLILGLIHVLDSESFGYKGQELTFSE